MSVLELDVILSSELILAQSLNKRRPQKDELRAVQSDEDKLGALCVILLLVGVGIILVYSLMPSYPTHYEEQISNEELKAVKFRFRGLLDTNISLSFVDDPDLMYSVVFVAYTSFPDVNLDSHDNPLYDDRSPSALS